MYILVDTTRVLQYIRSDTHQTLYSVPSLIVPLGSMRFTLYLAPTSCVPLSGTGLSVTAILFLLSSTARACSRRLLPRIRRGVRLVLYLVSVVRTPLGNIYRSACLVPTPAVP